MDIIAENNNIILENAVDFDLKDIFTCGQCFRFNKTGDSEYTGTAFGKTVRISQCGNRVVFYNTSEADFRNVWFDYFDLGRDYSEIKAQLLKANDSVMENAVHYGSGIRILKQELWETVVSFIISASNNIPRIKKIIELLCENFGEKHCYEGNVYFSFPQPKVIAKLSEGDLSVIRAGFRTKYILASAKAVDSGEFDLTSLFELSTADAKKALRSLSGIGNKVSDCILLFALNRFDSFPIDVWIKRIVEFCYFENREQSIKTISEFAAERFGNLGGIAQQYLFYYAHDLRIGT